ncbi:MAG: PqiC family protein [Acetobacter sp.]|nr:PqiC family protein [Acetobacter sp.]
MKKILILALAVLTTACSSPTPHFYQPIAVQTVTVTYPKVKSTLLLNQVLLPAEAARPQITTIGAKDYDVRIDEFNRWGATPEKLVQRVLNQNLSLALPNAIIENQTPLRKNYKYAVAVEITEMSGKLDKFATLKSSYFIRNKMGRVVKSGRFANSVEISGGYEEYVPAQSSLLGELAELIAKDIARLP